MPQVAIIGGGVVGMTTAYALVRNGHSVTVIEPHEGPAREASYANGGQLSYRYVAPLADAGVPLKALGWMLKGDDAPLKFRPRLSPTQWRWSLSFLAACRRSVNQRNGAHLLRLSLFSQKVLQEWREQDGLDGFAWQRNGKLVIYRKPESFERAASGIDPEDERRVLTPAACVEHEPALSAIKDQIVGGVLSPSDEAGDCRLFCEALEQRLLESGRYRRLRDRVVTFEHGSGRVQGITLESGEVLCPDDTVLAAGNASAALARKLAIELPLYPLKGYSLTVPARDGCPSVSVTDFDNKVVYARLGKHLRVAAMVDIGSTDTRVSPARMAALKALCRHTFPTAGDYDNAQEWAGQRPSTPEGPPVLGTTRFANLWLNVGHGSLGFTLSCASAAVLAHLIDRRPSPISLDGLTLSR